MHLDHSSLCTHAPLKPGFHSFKTTNLFLKKTLVFFINMLMLACTNKKDEPATRVEKTAAVVEPSADITVGNQRYADLARQVFGNLSSCNVDQWAESLAEKTLYRWNNFDSLGHKAVIGDYWKKASFI
jgi:hypothetical protein